VRDRLSPRALIGAVFGAAAAGEQDWARKLAGAHTSSIACNLHVSSQLTIKSPGTLRRPIGRPRLHYLVPPSLVINQSAKNAGGAGVLPYE
jgi:hypothetical protein